MEEVEDMVVNLLLPIREWSRRKRFLDVVSCAYCNGTGMAPVNGYTCRCPVCGAIGRIEVIPPVVTCLRCSGAGRENGNLTCLACKGLGSVAVARETGACFRCKGTGDEGVLYCLPCKGQGIT